MGHLLHDPRYALRQLRRTPGFALTAVLTLALGVGATTAIFTLMYQVLLRSIPVQQPEQLYKIGKDNDCCVSGGFQDNWGLFSYDLYRTLRDETPGISGMAAVQAGSIGVTVRRAGEAAAQPLQARAISGNYFQVLGVQPFAGRLLRPDDDTVGAAPVAVLSHTLWQAKFHADPALVGQAVLLAGKPFTVVGIAAENFLGERNTGDPAGIWVPLAQQPQLEPERKLYEMPGSHWLDILLRVDDAKKAPAIQTAVQVELVRWLRSHRDPTDRHTEAELNKQTTQIVSASSGINNFRDQYEKSLKLLLLIAGFVLLITCANLANLLLVRGMARSQELSVRTALGAPRLLLVRQMLVEALLLAAAGGLLSLPVAYAGVKGVLALAMKGVESSPLSASPSLPVLLFAFAVSLLTGVLFGTAPAWIATSVNPANALRGANRSTGDASARPQKVLVMLQAALSVVVLSTSGLLIASLRNLQRQDFHFQPEGRLVAFIDIAASGLPYERLDGLYKQWEQAFAAVPGVHDFAYATYGPMNYNRWGGGVSLEGGDPNARPNASYTAVSPSFFSAVGTRVLLGRVFTEHDTATSTHVAVVNKTFVDKLLHGKQAIGTHFGPVAQLAHEYEIVGVVDDSKYGDPTEQTNPMYFTPMAQHTSYAVLGGSPAVQRQYESVDHSFHYASNLFVRYDGDPATTAATVRRTLLSVAPDIPINRLLTYSDQVGNYFTTQQLVVQLTMLFGVLALMLAAVGIYGVTAYSVGRRTNEIGVRMALGADRGSVLRLILKGAMGQTGIGLLVGVPLSLAAGHLLQAQLYEVKGWSPLPLLVSCTLLLCSAAVAGLVPARRASTIDPARALHGN